MDLRSNTKQYITPELFGVFYGLLNFRLVLSMSNIFLCYTFPVNSFSARLGCVPTISHFILQSPTPVSLSYGVNAKTNHDAFAMCAIYISSSSSLSHCSVLHLTGLSHCSMCFILLDCLTALCAIRVCIYPCVCLCV